MSGTLWCRESRTAFLVARIRRAKATYGKRKKHFKMEFIQEDRQVDVVAFNGSSYYDDVYNKTEVELIGTFNVNEWKGYKKPQIFLKGMRYEPKFEAYLKEATTWFELIDKGQIDDVFTAYHFRCTRNDCIDLYRMLRGQLMDKVVNIDVFKFNGMVQGNQKDLKVLIKNRLILDIFHELGFIEIQKQEAASYQIRMNKTQTVELEKSTLYNKMC